MILFIIGTLGMVSIYFYWFRSFSFDENKVITQRGEFTLGNEIPVPRTEGGGVAIGEKMYILGGINSLAATLNDFFVYNVNDGSWEQLSNLPHYVNHPGVTTDGKDLYLVGGFKPLGIRLRGFMFAKWNPYDLLFKYDTENNQWIELAKMPAPRGGGGVCFGEGKIWYVGGINENREVASELFAYEIKTDSWETMEPMQYARDHMRMEYVNGNLYAISGRKDDLRFNFDYLEKYEIESGIWSSLPPIPTPRGGFASVVYRDQILTFGGENVWTCFDEIESFDTKTETWTQFDYLPEGRHGIIAGVINDRIHLISGGKHPRVSISRLHRIYTLN